MHQEFFRTQVTLPVRYPMQHLLGTQAQQPASGETVLSRELLLAQDFALSRHTQGLTQLQPSQDREIALDLVGVLLDSGNTVVRLGLDAGCILGPRTELIRFRRLASETTLDPIEALTCGGKLITP